MEQLRAAMEELCAARSGAEKRVTELVKSLAMGELADDMRPVRELLLSFAPRTNLEFLQPDVLENSVVFADMCVETDLAWCRDERAFDLYLHIWPTLKPQVIHRAADALRPKNIRLVFRHMRVPRNTAHRALVRVLKSDASRYDGGRSRAQCIRELFDGEPGLRDKVTNGDIALAAPFPRALLELSDVTLGCVGKHAVPESIDLLAETPQFQELLYVEPRNPPAYLRVLHHAAASAASLAADASPEAFEAALRREGGASPAPRWGSKTWLQAYYKSTDGHTKYNPAKDSAVIELRVAAEEPPRKRQAPAPAPAPAEEPPHKRQVLPRAAPVFPTGVVMRVSQFVGNAEFVRPMLEGRRSAAAVDEEEAFAHAAALRELLGGEAARLVEKLDALTCTASGREAPRAADVWRAVREVHDGEGSRAPLVRSAVKDLLERRVAERRPVAAPLRVALGPHPDRELMVWTHPLDTTDLTEIVRSIVCSGHDADAALYIAEHSSTVAERAFVLRKCGDERGRLAVLQKSGTGDLDVLYRAAFASTGEHGCVVSAGQAGGLHPDAVGPLLRDVLRRREAANFSKTLRLACHSGEADLVGSVLRAERRRKASAAAWRDFLRNIVYSSVETRVFARNKDTLYTMQRCDAVELTWICPEAGGILPSAAVHAICKDDRDMLEAMFWECLPAWRAKNLRWACLFEAAARGSLRCLRCLLRGPPVPKYMLKECLHAAISTHRVPIVRALLPDVRAVLSQRELCKYLLMAVGRPRVLAQLVQAASTPLSYDQARKARARAVSLACFRSTEILAPLDTAADKWACVAKAAAEQGRHVMLQRVLERMGPESFCEVIRAANASLLPTIVRVAVSRGIRSDEISALEARKRAKGERLCVGALEQLDLA